ncbi:hypothetical protein MBOVJF4428_00112 [Mycoplasmopsis agalactiae]|uniref:Uncharacterized protein n=3 Tax=Bacteria TaxID=2 RepID=D1CJ43_MYCAP|nr:hypothetical protein [Mycoplasmopsis agalactiae]KAB6718445.1 hypothetical protein E4L58_02965 [Mycoplasmopsis agalactiae]MCE6056498.1 hypothetical protein [Mycoplasmopsis agalactiae]MCE6057241.1 hypothetical protein [Mycoplasmopsis agalactiae]MCE6061764.1 hypothetical protein [Mycoplasmopsis agalactiae]MCE6079027.1 hypothetical protein [Mycoplasmopsis agalactiae]
MKKVKIKSLTIVWSILALIALVLIIYCSIIIHNALFIIDINNFVSLDTTVISQARYQMAYSIAGISISVIIFLIGIFIAYAGIKSWNYKAIL